MRRERRKRRCFKIPFYFRGTTERTRTRTRTRTGTRTRTRTRTRRRRIGLERAEVETRKWKENGKKAFTPIAFPDTDNKIEYDHQWRR